MIANRDILHLLFSFLSASFYFFSADFNLPGSRGVRQPSFLVVGMRTVLSPPPIYLNREETLRNKAIKSISTKSFGRPGQHGTLLQKGSWSSKTLFGGGYRWWISVVNMGYFFSCIYDIVIGSPPG
jgi:hypothetical protein